MTEKQPTRVIIAYKVLIYAHDEECIRHLSYHCKQLGMLVVVAHNKGMAESLIRDEFFELAIVDLSLEVLLFADYTKVISTGVPSRETLMREEYYGSKEFIPQPLADAQIRMVLIRVSGLLVEAETYYANLVTLLNTVQYLHFRLFSFLNDPTLFFGIKELVCKYCVEQCMFGVAPSSVDSATENYEFVALESARGPVVCKFVKKCMLHKLSAHITEEHAAISGSYAADLVRTYHFQDPPKNIAEAMRLLSGVYKDSIQQFIKIKDAFCREHCESVDTTSMEYEKRVKKLCCEYGCVLDNYLDLTQAITNERKRSVVLYVADVKELKILTKYCEQLNLEIFVADSEAAVTQFFNEHTIDVIVIDYSLERVVVPSRTKIVIIGKRTLALTVSMIHYFPVSYIPTPFEISYVSLGMLKALGFFYHENTLFAFLANLSIIVDIAHMAFHNVMSDEVMKRDMKQSLAYFCENSCEFARRKHEIKFEELKDYVVLNVKQRRGAVYCKLKKTCPLWQFHQWLTGRQEALVTESLSGFLHNYRCGENDFSFVDTLGGLHDRISEMIQAQEAIKHTYCSTQCPKRKQDMHFSAKDNVFTDFTEMCTMQQCTYCTYHKCPLAGFYEYQRKSIV